MLEHLINPERTTDPARAHELVRTTGAVILVGAEASDEGSLAAARAVLSGRALEIRYQFGIEIPVLRALKEVFGDGSFEIPEGRFGDETETVREWVGFFTEFLAHRSPPDNTKVLPAHVDGYALGDAAPDYIFQTFAQQSDVGGESVLIDAPALVASLSPELVDFLCTVPVDNTEPGLTPSFGPVLTRTSSGRERIVRHIEQATHPDSVDKERDGALLEQWQATVEDLTAHAPGFKVAHGETLCLDNYRLLHARLPYDDVGREVFVSWAWTADAISLPPKERLTFAAT